MEKFCQHIEKLLAQHDYVVVPDLGGFVVQMQSAKLFSDHITPPLSTIGFNPLMHHADGLLAIEIARSEKISYRMAMEYIQKQVECLHSALKTSGNIQFGNLGIFYQNEPGSLFFTPEVKVGFLPQNFELTDLYMSQKDMLKNTASPKITISLPSTRIFKYASVAILVFGLFFISPQINDMRQMGNANIATSAFYNSSQKPLIPVATTKIEIPLKTTVATDSANYHVIVASLPNQKTADKFCNELVASNFPTAHVLPSSSTNRIAICSFSDRNKAIQFMENLRRNDHRFETAWVFCN